MVLVDGPAVLPILVPDDTDEAAEIPEATEIPLLPLSEMPSESSSPVRPGPPGRWACPVGISRMRASAIPVRSHRGGRAYRFRSRSLIYLRGVLSLSTQVWLVSQRILNFYWRATHTPSSTAPRACTSSPPLRASDGLQTHVRARVRRL